MFHVPEGYRVRSGPRATDSSYGNNGAFWVPKSVRRKMALQVIASDGFGWEHVSVSTPVRCPTWEEMSEVKGLFWDDTDTVIQFHPPRSEYVNNHPYCLHLWRSTEFDMVLPPSILTGIKELGVLA